MVPPESRELAAGAIATGLAVVLGYGVFTGDVDPTTLAVGLLVLLSFLVGVTANRFTDPVH